MQSQHGSRLGTGITDDDVLQIIFREPLIANTPSTVNAPSQIGEVLAAAYHNANALGFCSRNCICLRISVDGYGLWVAFVFLDPASTNALLHWCENQRRPFLTRICAGRCPTQPAAARAAHWKRGAKDSDYPSRPRQRLRRGRVERGGKIVQPPITVIIGGRALLMLIAARFSGSGSGKDLLSRAISLIASGLLPFSSFPRPIAPDTYRGRDRPACRIPGARRGMVHRVRPQ